MTAKQLTKYTSLPTAEVDMGQRLRPVSGAGVAALKASIEELGIMKDPIHVRQIKKTGKFVLMAGAHRLTVAQELGWDTIPATVWECTNSWAELMEIDDNLAGAELTVLDTAVFLAERQRVYEALHPETVQGKAGAKARWDATDTMSVASFSVSAAEKLGASERHVRRLVAVGKCLNADDRKHLRAADRPVTLSDLQVIAKIGDDAQRSKVCKAMSADNSASASSALKALQAQPGDAVTYKGDEHLRKLNDLFARCSASARRQFVADKADVLRELLEAHDASEGSTPAFGSKRGRA